MAWLEEVWIVTREEGNGRNRTVVGVYTTEEGARERIARAEEADKALDWDYDLEAFDVLGEEV